MIDWTITFHDAVCDHEIEELADNATFHGIDDFTVTESRRIIKAETVRDDDAINWIASWLGQSIYAVEIIAQIKEERVYWPEFEEEDEPKYTIRLESDD